MATPRKKTRRTPRKRSSGPPRQKGQKRKSVTAEYLKVILLAVGLALLVRTFLVQAFRIPSGSMEDTLLVGDFLLASKFLYGPKIPFTDIRLPGFRDPEPGDIIIFQYPKDPSRDFIKRCLAGPGQTVEVRDKVLYVDGKRAVDPPHSKYVDARIQRTGNRDNFAPQKVPPDHYFMMGDNRDSSEDSRYWGFLSQKWIKGNATIIYWSWAPDANAPTYRNLASIPKILLYNLLNIPRRTRWSRIGALVK